MTKRLYYTDAYLQAFNARVVAREDDGRRVFLDETAFYPTSGGQQHDLGVLGGIRVVDVIDDNDRIAHLLEAPLGASENVHGTVDWARRFDHMQQHTGQHLVSAVFAELFGWRTASVHFGADSSTVELESDSITRNQLIAAEQRANDVVTSDVPVTVSFQDAADATGLRKESKREGTLRIVSIEGVDRSACGGTHVSRSAEIGAIALRRVEKIRKNTRVEFLCGGRVLRRMRKDFEALTAIATGLSASLDDAPDLARAQTESLRESEQARRRLERELAAHQARELYNRVEPNARGIRFVEVRGVPGNMDSLKTLAQAALELPGMVLAASSDDQPSLVLAVSDGVALDAGKILKEALAAVGGRGGGSARLAQGSAPGDSVSAVLHHVATLVLSNPSH